MELATIKIEPEDEGATPKVVVVDESLETKNTDSKPDPALEKKRTRKPLVGEQKQKHNDRNKRRYHENKNANQQLKVQNVQKVEQEKATRERRHDTLRCHSVEKEL